MAKPANSAVDSYHAAPHRSGPLLIVKTHTPVELHEGIFVKREDKCCEEVPLSKARGAWDLIRSVSAPVIVCLDTYRSLNGLLTAACCASARKRAVIYYPTYKGHEGYIAPWHRVAADRYRAELRPLQATRQGVMKGRMLQELRLRASMDPEPAFVMPDAFKLKQTMMGVSAEYQRTVIHMGFRPDTVIVPVGTGTHLIGIMRSITTERVIAVLGYTRSHEQLQRYVGSNMEPERVFHFDIVDRGYGYRDREDLPCPFPASPYYETKAWRWLQENPRRGRTLFWNVGAGW